MTTFKALQINNRKQMFRAQYLTGGMPRVVRGGNKLEDPAAVSGTETGSADRGIVEDSGDRTNRFVCQDFPSVRLQMSPLMEMIWSG